MALLISLFLALGIISSPVDLSEQLILDNQEVLHENELGPDIYEF